MDKLIGREGRYTKYSFVIFFYGIIFIPVMLMNFRHGTRGVENFPAYIFSGLFSLTCAVLIYTLKMRLKAVPKFIMFMLVISIINFFIWFVLCDGTLIYKQSL